MKNIYETKLAILLCRAAGVTSFLWGARGLGKSASHSQIAEAHRWGFIDLRCSQMEASDLRGLPDKNNGMTVYLPPADLPRGHEIGDTCPSCDLNVSPTNFPANKYCNGILFLDELNRAEDDVLQATFQLVLDKKVGLYKLPKGWSIHVAGNYTEGYLVNAFLDPAFLNRFCHLQIFSGDDYYKDWVGYMMGFGANYDKIIQFVGFNKDHLYGKVKGDLGFSIQPSPRSWEMVAKVEKAFNETKYFDPTTSEQASFPSDIKREVIAGLIGPELSIMYDKFTCEVTPDDIMHRGLDSVKRKLEGLNRNQLVGVVWGVAANAKNHKTENIIKNVLDFIEWIIKSEKSDDTRDLAVSLGRQLCSEEVGSALGGAMLSNPILTKFAAMHNKKKNMNEPTWIRALTERPELQKLMSGVSYATK